MKIQLRGFSLIETSIALAILALAAVGIAAALLAAGRLSANAEDRERALSAARERLEWARQTPVEEVLLQLAGNPDPSLLEAGPVVETFAVPGLRGAGAEPGLLRLTLRDEVPGTPGHQRLFIIARVRWGGAGDPDAQVFLSTTRPL